MPKALDTNTALNELTTLGDALNWGKEQFEKAELYFGHGTDNAWDEAVFLALHVLQLPPDVDAHILEARLTKPKLKKILALFARRINERKPAAYLIKEAWFGGLPFYVDQRVLIPRSPLAELIEERFEPWKDNLKIRRILDIGTGSGCLAIACAKSFPQAKIDASDIDDDALTVAKINIKKHQVNKQVRLMKSDLFANVPQEIYDIIISNPPYVTRGEYNRLPKEYTHEPHAALVAGVHGLKQIVKILSKAARYLTAKGLLIVEVGNSETALVKRYPKVPFLWLEFSRGGGGVFLLTREQLEEYWNK